MKLQSYVKGRWFTGSGAGREFCNPATGEHLGFVDDTGLDADSALDYGRKTGTRALGSLTFSERGEILKGVADVLSKNRERYFEIARINSGNTKTDASIDIDGAIATLKTYARFGKTLGSAVRILEPGTDQLAKEAVSFSRHIWTSRPGAALQINAFNFPSWGLWEKVAVAILSGVASIAKPASSTAWLSYEMVRDVILANVVPEGGLSLVCGTGNGLIDGLQTMDSLAFTGSADTALKIRSNNNILTKGARITIEADSVNATIVGPDCRVGSSLFETARLEINKALYVKAGQFCTNIRRVFVHQDQLADWEAALANDAGKIIVGNPADASVKMGPLANFQQREAALNGIRKLTTEARIVAGGNAPTRLIDADPKVGAYVAPTILSCSDPDSAIAVHETEVFGPCLTLIPYRSVDRATEMACRAGGSLVVSLFSADPKIQLDVLATLAPWHGRVLIVDSEVGGNHTGHAIVMPQCVHGGPGRAGNGEELGGVRGLRFHMQRSAIQGSAVLHKILSENSTETSL